MELIKSDININFIGVRKIAYTVSLTLLVLSIISLIIHKGPRYGVDFEGGASIQIKFQGHVTIENIKNGITALGIDDASVQRFGLAADNEYQIRSSLAVMKDGFNEALKTKLSESTGVAVVDVTVEQVGAQASKDLREKALFAIFFALLLIAIYISGRFELKWLLGAMMAAAIGIPVYFILQLGMKSGMTFVIIFALVISLAFCWYLRLKYALGVIVALIHDVTITVGVFSVLNMEFTLQIVAALLTIIGYSMNDTIIVYDRIRENTAKHPKEPIHQIINRSINETLSRTILTSVLTFTVVLALYAFGGSVIHHFAFAMMIGIIVGTFSSIYVASPILTLGMKDENN